MSCAIANELILSCLAILPCSYVPYGTVSFIDKWTCWEDHLETRNYADRLRHRASPIVARSGARAGRTAALFCLVRALPGALTSPRRPTPRDSSVYAPLLCRRKRPRTDALAGAGPRGVAALRAELPLLPRRDAMLYVELLFVLPNFTPSRCTHGRANDTMARSSL